jgi:starvation-inducible outer membrane lipoprotein
MGRRSYGRWKESSRKRLSRVNMADSLKEGKKPAEAIYQGCLIRFRPIMMTTLSALLAPLPIAVGFGAGAESRRPMDLAVVGGLLFSQIILYYPGHLCLPGSAAAKDKQKSPIISLAGRGFQKMRRKKLLFGRLGARMMAESETASSLSKRKAGWGILFRVFALGAWVMAASACAHPISSLVRAEADPTLTLAKVLENPKAYLGSIVIWGGVISKVSRGAEGSRLLVIQAPLDSHGRPQTQETQGAFIARTSESLDPRVYRRGLKITLAGDIEAVEEKNLGPMEYPRPVLRIIEIHPWKEELFPLTHGNWEGGLYAPASPFEEPFLKPGNGE